MFGLSDRNFIVICLYINLFLFWFNVGNIEFIKLLVKVGVDVNVIDKDGFLGNDLFYNKSLVCIEIILYMVLGVVFYSYSFIYFKLELFFLF